MTKAKDARSKPIAGLTREKVRTQTGASADLVGEAGVRPARRSSTEPLQDARITFVISNAAKKRIYTRAKREGGSVADYIRAAIEGYDPSAAEEEAQLRALLDAFKVTHQETLDTLDATEAKLDALTAKLEAAAR